MQDWISIFNKGDCFYESFSNNTDIQHATIFKEMS